MSEVRERTDLVRGYAQTYIDAGWSIMPTESGGKAPLDGPGWGKVSPRKDTTDFNYNTGIGVRLGPVSGNLVDVDLDCPQAVRAAAAMLPATARFGHGDPLSLSHHVFYCENAPTVVFEDLNGRKMIAEIRGYSGDGETLATHQTVLPPTPHEDGTVRVWEGGEFAPDKIAAVRYDDLLRRVRMIATMALIARAMPPEGGRHAFVLPLAGYLVRHLGDEELVRQMLVGAWHLVGASEEACRDVENAVKAAVNNLDDRKYVTGGPTLERIVDGLPARLAEFWDFDAPSEKNEGNEADRLLAYAREDAGELFLDQHGLPHAFAEGKPVPLTTRCYAWLRRVMLAREGKITRPDNVRSVAQTLYALAEVSGVERELHTRAAWHDGALYYQLSPGRIVEVDKFGWRIVADAPVMFRHLPNLKELPDPVRGGSLDDLDRFVHLSTDADRRLMKAYAVSAVLPHIARPILLPTGPAGSGKTTLSRLIKRTLDPTEPEAIRTDGKDFLQKASHTFIVMLDNLGHISGDTSDTLCRLVTGESDSKRIHYSDDDDFIYSIQRAVLANGINLPTERADFLDRALVIELSRIPDNERKLEADYWRDFEMVHPRILGAIFDALSGAMRSNVRPLALPRLADWGTWAARVYNTLGWTEYDSDWSAKYDDQNEAVIESSPVARAVLSFMDARDRYDGTAGELLVALTPHAPLSGQMPVAPKTVWPRIQEVQGVLNARGVYAVKGTRTRRGVMIHLYREGVARAA